MIRAFLCLSFLLLSGSANAAGLSLFSTRAAAVAASIGGTITEVWISGYSSPSDGCEIKAVKVGSQPSHPGKFQSADGAWWEYVAQNNEVNVCQFGGKGDWNGTTGTDNWQAFENAKAFIIAKSTNYGYTKGGMTLRVGAGRFYLSDTHQIKGASYRLAGLGSGSGMAGGWPTTLTFAASKAGIIVHTANTIGATYEAVSTGAGGDGSIIEGLLIESLGGTGAYDGIWPRARVAIRDVVVADFPQDCIRIQASAGAHDATEGNANNWQIWAARLQGCKRHGLYVKGADVNAGVSIGVDASANLGWGIYDSSFLGNTHIAAHAAGNTLGPYKADNANARNSFFGSYSESDQSTSQVDYPGIVTSGTHAAGVAGTGDFWINGGFPNGVVAGTTTLSAALGGNEANGDLLRIGHSMDFPSFFRLRKVGTDLRCDYANLNNNVSCVITGPNTALTFGRSATVPHAFAFPSLFAGSGDNARNIDTAASAPSSACGVGDIKLNRSASAGGKVGWVCVNAAGTWKAFGVIDP